MTKPNYAQTYIAGIYVDRLSRTIEQCRSLNIDFEDCLAKARARVQRDPTSVDDDPRDSSIDIVREQRP